MHRLCRVFTVILCCLAAISATAQVDRVDRERFRNMLRTVAAEVSKNFYDSGLKGLDWKQLEKESEAKIENAKTQSEMITVISAFVQKLDDSHTRFLPPSRVNRPLFGFETKMFGDEARIYSLKPGGAAAMAGLQLGDRIVSIFNYRPERKTFDEAMLYYRVLHPMSELKITYQRGAAPPQTVTVTAKVKKGTMAENLTTIDNIERYLVENFSDEERYFYGTFDGDIGFAQVPSFSAEEVPAVHALEHLKAIVLDMRGNPGGRVDALAEFAGHFESKPAVLASEISRKKNEPVKIKPHSPNFAVPMFILVDSRTASAGEMFARYFQKTGQAKVIGDLSSGRVNASRYFSEELGTQNLVTFGVQISVARVAFQDGEELEHHGVVPDVPCLPGEEDLREQRDPCLAKAVMLARQAAGKPGELPAKVAGQVAGMVGSINEYKAEQLKRPD